MLSFLVLLNTIQKQGVVITLSTTMLLTCITYIILFYIVLLINHEQGARTNDKEKRLSPEWL